MSADQGGEPSNKRRKTLLPVYIDVENINKSECILIPVDESIDTKRETARICMEMGVSQTNDVQTVKRQLDHTIGVFKDAFKGELDPHTVELVSIYVVVPITVDGSQMFFDVVTWNVNSPTALIDVYATTTVNEMGLPYEFAVRISRAFQDSLKTAKEKLKAGKQRSRGQMQPNEVIRDRQLPLPAIMSKTQVQAFLKRGRPSTDAKEAAAAEAENENMAAAAEKAENAAAAAAAAQQEEEDHLEQEEQEEEVAADEEGDDDEEDDDEEEGEQADQEQDVENDDDDDEEGEGEEEDGEEESSSGDEDDGNESSDIDIVN